MRDADAPLAAKPAATFTSAITGTPTRPDWRRDRPVRSRAQRQNCQNYGSSTPTLNHSRNQLYRGDKDAALARIQAVFPQPEHQHDNLDGPTVVVNDHTWFNVRGSNTEPVMRLNAESSDKRNVDDLVAKVGI